MKTVLAAFIGAALPVWAAAPNYSASSVVNAASNVAGPVAPNTIVSLYGTDLSWNTRSVRAEDVSSGLLPTYIPGGGVSVYVNNLPAGLYYVSPTQVNFLVPAAATPGRVRLAVARDGVRGPEVEITLGEVAPALFQLDPDFVVATRADGSAIGRENPARAGEIVTLYANGLGPLVPPLRERAIAEAAAPIARMADFRIALNGVEVAASAVLYAGAAPGFAGLYQINVELPTMTRENPEIRIGFGPQLSREGVRLLAKP
ncbi:MAG TPA: hypothetical protein VFL57_02595 [Bryobacteraceae bacterium]|nr:hypothetical protein [Bryobacteraceae bacterium]